MSFLLSPLSDHLLISSNASSLQVLLKAVVQVLYVKLTRVKPGNGVETFGGSLSACLACVHHSPVKMAARVLKESMIKATVSSTADVLWHLRARSVTLRALWLSLKILVSDLKTV